MAFVKIVCLFGMMAVAVADVNEIVGANQYLPPSASKGGYNYDRPSVGFPASSPSAARPTPSYAPPAPPRPSPSYAPPAPPRPSPSYAPPRPSPTYAPLPTPTRPPPVYQPSIGTAPSGTSGIAIGTGHQHDESHDHHEPGMPYDFEYKVKDDYYGTDYSRNEVSDGDVIRGEYRVQLPDGRLQIVKYTADWKNGFHADVSYEGEPQYPAASNNQGYPAAGGPSNSYGPPSSASSPPSQSYGPPSSAGY